MILSSPPQFLEDLMVNADPADLKAAMDSCGESKMCLFDTLATANADIGLATMTLNNMNMDSMKSASKYKKS